MSFRLPGGCVGIAPPSPTYATERRVLDLEAENDALRSQLAAAVRERDRLRGVIRDLCQAAENASRDGMLSELPVVIVQFADRALTKTGEGTP